MSMKMMKKVPSIKFKKYKSHDCQNCKSKTNLLADSVWCDLCSPIHLQREFIKWTSDNKEVDEFIRFQQIKAKKSGNLLEWIPYDRLSNIEHVAQGGCSKVYSAMWSDGLIQGWNFRQERWNRIGKTKVALKVLKDSRDISSEFLEEIHLDLQRGSKQTLKCFGLTKEPKSGNFAMVLEYLENGNLRDYLNMSRPIIDWYQKVEIMKQIARHLCLLHEKGIIHKNFHIGNIFYETNNHNDCSSIMGDLGIHKHVGVNPYLLTQSSEIYGVLPYVAPEVLREESPSKASDIYSFGGIIYEIVSGYPPFHDRPHDFQLALDICNGVRPIIPEHVPKSIVNLLKRCWDPDPKKRITAIEIFSMIKCCFIYEDERKISQRLTKEIEESKCVQNLNSFKIHPETFYTSRLLSFPKLEEALALVAP